MSTRRSKAWRSLVFALIATSLVCASGCEQRGLFGPPTLEPLVVRADGPWLRDRKGRVVLLRGINLSPADQMRILALPENERGAVFARLGALGFNLVRLQIQWRFLAPMEMALADVAQRDHIDPLLRLATSEGMVVVLTLRAGGRAAPPWMLSARDTGNIDPRASWAPLSCDLAASPGGSQPKASSGASDVAAAAADAAQVEGEGPDDLAQERSPASLKRRFARVWSWLGRRYGYDVRIVGFDLLDEPLAECPPSPATSVQLGALYAEVAKRLRERQVGQTLLLEPPAMPGATMPKALGDLPPPVAYAPHAILATAPEVKSDPAAYTPELEVEALIAQEDRRADMLSMPLLIGEIGSRFAPATAPGSAAVPLLAVPIDDERGRALSAAEIRAASAALDRRLASGAFAAGAGMLTTRLDESVSDDTHAIRAALAHPFPRRIAGIPVDLSFDEESATLTLSYEDDPDSRPPDPTEIYLPEEIFPGAIEVETAGRWRFEPELHRLLVYRGAGDTHEVSVRPKRPRRESAP